MKKVLLFLIAVLTVAACSSDSGSLQSKWEYKIVIIENEQFSEFAASEINVSSKDLNQYGEEGWELVDVYTIIETEHPNFGNSEYVTGIRENTRTSSVNCVFKRKK